MGTAVMGCEGVKDAWNPQFFTSGKLHTKKEGKKMEFPWDKNSRSHSGLWCIL